MAHQSKIEIILSAVDRGLTTGFNRAMASVRAFVSDTKQAESGVKGLASSVSGLIGPLLASVSAAAGMQKLVAVAREFDKLSAGLVTATGSTEGAEQAFVAIQDFATKTPYDLAQVTDSFVKLVNFGLDPSERALTSYGNTSSALGKNLNQMIEAVADAATGEFERLKEFGIKSKTEGDKVSFTFRGVTTTVGKNAKEIEEYLIKLGETNFGAAMANRMKTLDGALSNLGDEWNKVFLNISKAGIGDMIANGVRIAISALEELNAMIASGELVGYLRSIVGQFSGWADDIKATIALVSRYYHDNLEQLKIDGKDAVTFLIDAFRRFPENVRAFIGLMVVEVAAGLDKASAYAVAFKNGIAAVFTDQTFAGVGSQLERELQVINSARDESIGVILGERDAAISSANAQTAAAKKLRAEYDAGQEAAKANTADRLAQFRVQGDASKKAAGTAKDAWAAFDAQVKSVENSIKAVNSAAELASAEKIMAYQKELLGAAHADVATTSNKIDLLDQEIAKYQQLQELIPGSDIKNKKSGDDKETELDRKINDLLIKRAELIIAANAAKMRAMSQEKILGMELEKIEASKLPTALQRAEAELAIDRRIMAERINLKQQELDQIKADEKASQADIIRAESELAEMRVDIERQLNDKLRDLANIRLQDTEKSWRQGIASVQEYQAAVQAALAAGAIDQETAHERLIASGDDMAAALELGFQHAREKTQTNAEIMIQIGEQLGDRLADGLTSAWDAYVNGTKNAKDAMIDFARSTLSWLSQVIMKQMLLNALKVVGSAMGYADGGPIQQLASGGEVAGWSPHKKADNIPIWATAREFMQPVDSVDYYGLSFMEAIRRRSFPRNLAHALAGGTLPRVPSGYRLAAGGQVPGQPTTVRGGDTKLKVVNVLDGNLVGDYLRTSAGETTLINMIRRNGSAIRTIIGS